MISWIKKVIKSRFIYNKKVPFWVKERRDLCGKCKYNFKNRSILKIKFTDYWWYFLNGFNSQCTICNCGVKFKTKIKDEYCSLENIGKKPKWDIYNE